MVTCHTSLLRLDAYVDGELAPDSMVAVDCHLVQCRICLTRVLFERAFRAGIRNATRSDQTPTNALIRRIREAIIVARAPRASSSFGATCCAGGTRRTGEEGRPTNDRSISPPFPISVATWFGTPLPWHWSSRHLILPVVAIILIVLIWVSDEKPVALVAPTAFSDVRLSQLDSTLDFMMAHHTHTTFQSAYGSPVQLSVETSLMRPFSLPPMYDVQSLRVQQRQLGVSALSAWPTALLGQSAHYNINGHQVTFFMYRAQAAPLRARLAGRIVDGHVVYVGDRRGYSIATIETGPVGCAVTSDLSSAQNASIIVSALSNIVAQ